MQVWSKVSGTQSQRLHSLRVLLAPNNVFRVLAKKSAYGFCLFLILGHLVFPQDLREVVFHLVRIR